MSDFRLIMWAKQNRINSLEKVLANLDYIMICGKLLSDSDRAIISRYIRCALSQEKGSSKLHYEAKLKRKFYKGDLNQPEGVQITLK